MARPRKAIDEGLLHRLALIHCTTDEIAATLGVHKRTIERRYAAVMNAAREEGKSSLRRVMWKKALEGNERLMIWLSKQHLGYREPRDPAAQAAVEAIVAGNAATRSVVDEAVEQVRSIAEDIARFHRE